MKRPIGIRMAALAAATLLSACVPTRTAELWPWGFNPVLRPDRMAPTTQQKEVFDPPQDRTDHRRFGPYRHGTAEIVSALLPDRGPVAHIVQSDCWWMAQSPNGGGDGMRAHWEQVMEIQGEAREVLEGGFAALCRMNDPYTREPWHAKDSDVVGDLDCSHLHEDQAITWGNDEGIRCINDAQFTMTRLAARKASTQDPLRRCEAVAFAEDAPRVIAHGVDFFSGLSVQGADDISVSSCTNPAGELLIPAEPAQYVLSPGSELVLSPTLHPVGDATKLGRQMTQGGTSPARRWSTTVESGMLGQRWRENFSVSLGVRNVRLFRYDGTTTAYVPHSTSSAPLCIQDPVFGTGCRWQCDARADATGRIVYALFDGACRDAAGLVDLPRVTPTYAKDSTEVLVQDQPLAWSVNDGSSQPLWIEFELATTFAPAALRAEPARSDAGALRVGDQGRASFIVVNEGAQPLRIASVAMDAAQGGQPTEFLPQLPFAPVGIPLPFDVVAVQGDTHVVRIGAGAESQPWYTHYTDPMHWHLAPRKATFNGQFNGVAISSQRGLLIRDRIDADFRTDPASTIGVRATYALRTLPFTLAPGDAFEVSVLATPRATGDRWGFVRVRSSSAVDPSLRRDVLVRVESHGLRGPTLSAAPAQLVLYGAAAGASARRTVMIQNAGDVAGTIGAPVLRAPGGGPLPANSQLLLDDPYHGGGTLGIAESRVVHVDFRADCRNVAGDWRDEPAELRWTTLDGPVVVPIAATTYCGR